MTKQNVAFEPGLESIVAECRLSDFFIEVDISSEPRADEEGHWGYNCGVLAYVQEGRRFVARCSEAAVACLEKSGLKYNGQFGVSVPYSNDQREEFFSQNYDPNMPKPTARITPELKQCFVRADDIDAATLKDEGKCGYNCGVLALVDNGRYWLSRSSPNAVQALESSAFKFVRQFELSVPHSGENREKWFSRNYDPIITGIDNQ